MFTCHSHTENKREAQPWKSASKVFDSELCPFVSAPWSTFAFIFSWWVRNRKKRSFLKWTLWLAIPVAALHFDLCTIPDSSTSYLSPFAGEIPRHSTTCRVHLGTARILPTFFLSLIITVQKVWGEIYEYLIAFFFYGKKKDPPLERIKSGSITPNGQSLLDRLYLRPLAHAVDCDRYDHDIPFRRVINSKVHRLLTSVCRLDAHGTPSYHGNHPSSHPRPYVRSTAITYQSMYSHGALGNISALCAALSTEPHFNVASWLGLKYPKFLVHALIAGRCSVRERNLESNPGQYWLILVRVPRWLI